MPRAYVNSGQCMVLLTKLRKLNFTYILRYMNTLKCLSIGTPKAINFPFVSNEKLKFFRCPSIQAHCNEAVIYLNFGTPKIMNFPFETNGKFIIFRCPYT